MEIFAKEKKYEKYNYTDADAEKVIAELIEQIKQIEISIFYTLLNYNSEIVYLLSTDDFYSSWAQRYIKAIQSLVDENAEITAITVFDKIRELRINDDSDFARLIELQTATASIAGLKTVENLKKYIKQYKAYKRLQELQQKVVKNIEYSNEVDVESIVNEYADFLNEQESESDKKYISNSEILQCIENQDFEQKWLYKDFILTNSINILDGRGGSKKSRFAIQLAIHTVAQLDFLCFPFTNSEIGLDFKNVLYITPKTENNHRTIANIIVNVCKYHNIEYSEILRHLFFIQSAECLFVKSNKGIEPTKFYFYIKKISKQYRPDLIVIDPLMRIAGLELSNENIAFMYNFLEQLNSTILLIHHQPKGDLGKDISSTTALGGIMLRELARARFTLQKDVLLIEKNNLSQYYEHIIQLQYENNIFKTQQTEPYPFEFWQSIQNEKRTISGNGKNSKKY
ncbi:MAG: AAA family ATPase [Nitrososphaeria archaeon]